MKLRYDNCPRDENGWIETFDIWLETTGGTLKGIAISDIHDYIKRNNWAIDKGRIRKRKKANADGKLKYGRSMFVMPPTGLNTPPELPKRTITVSTLTREYGKALKADYDLYARWCFTRGKEPLSPKDFQSEIKRIIVV